MSKNNSQSKVFHPLYAEEIFIVYLNGRPTEIEEFEELLKDKEKTINQIRMILLVEEITRRELTKMDYMCCHECQFYGRCTVNRLRSERNLEHHCCSYCHKYRVCLKHFRDQKKAEQEAAKIKKKLNKKEKIATSDKQDSNPGDSLNDKK